MEGDEWNNPEFWGEFASPLEMLAWINEVLAQSSFRVSIKGQEMHQGRKGFPRWALKAMLKTLPGCRGFVSRETLYVGIEALLPLASNRDIDCPYGVC